MVPPKGEPDVRRSLGSGGVFWWGVTGRASKTRQVKLRMNIKKNRSIFSSCHELASVLQDNAHLERIEKLFLVASFLEHCSR